MKITPVHPPRARLFPKTARKGFYHRSEAAIVTPSAINSCMHYRRTERILRTTKQQPQQARGCAQLAALDIARGVTLTC